MFILTQKRAIINIITLFKNVIYTYSSNCTSLSSCISTTFVSLPSSVPILLNDTKEIIIKNTTAIAITIKNIPNPFKIFITNPASFCELVLFIFSIIIFIILITIKLNTYIFSQKPFKTPMKP